MPTTTQERAITNFAYKMGRKRPIARGPRLSLKNYVNRALPTPPATCDYTARAALALAKMYDNDQLGDCVIAGMAHVVGVMTANAGQPPYLYSEAEILALYSAIGGYDPADPNSDQGCDEQTALQYWENNGAPAGSTHRIAGWLAVDPSDPVEYRTALWLFENLYFGLELPDAWVQPTPQAGFVWNVAGDPNPNNGHCVAGFGYDGAGVTISTRGMEGVMTDAAIKKYAAATANGALYTVISQEVINRASQKAPNGFAWSQLVADFDSLGGNVSGVAPFGVRR